MALMGWGHSAFWAGAGSTGVPPPSTGPVWSYPLWMMTTVQQYSYLGSLWGVCQAWWDRVVLWWALARLCWGLSPRQDRAMRATLVTVRHPVFQTAAQAVRQTAVKPGMRSHHCWNEIGRVAKAWGWSENIYRRVDANETADRLLRASGSTATHLMRELAVELAYHDLKLTGR